MNITQIQKDVKHIHEKMDKFIESADKKFAGKWTERPLIWAMTMVGTAVFAAILSVVIINYN